MRLREAWKKAGQAARHAPPRHVRHASTSSAGNDEIDRARSYCLTLVKTYDSPAYTLQTFIPPPSRDAYLAIRAFNVDVSRVADATSNPTVGLMRMQFWRDAVTKSLAGSPPKEPVAVLLAAANENLQQRTDGQHKLSKSWLHRVISTREKYLSNPPYTSMAELESYAENTYSTLLYLTLQSLPTQSITADHIASHIGKATGIAAVLRGLPLIAFPPPPNKHSNQAGYGGSGGAQGAVTLPLDIMAEVGVKEEDVLRKGAAAPGLRDAVFEVATRANDHLITASQMVNNLMRGVDVGHEFEHKDEEEHDYGFVEDWRAERQFVQVERSFGALMQYVPTHTWLRKLQKVQFNIFDDRLRRRDWTLPWNAFWTYRTRIL